MVKERIDPVQHRTAELRRDWAIRKARALAERRAELDGGAARTTGAAIKDGVAKYYESHPHLRDKTKVTYKHGTDRFLVWCAANGVTSLDDLRRGHLQSFRAAVIAEPKRHMVKGGKRGERSAGDDPSQRSAFSVNRDLASVRVVLGWLRDADMLPFVTGDDLRRAFRRIKAAVEAIEYLQPHECRQLLQAALRHDAETFGETRSEHSSGAGRGAFNRRVVGGSKRYPPIAPFVAAALLTGMRRGELIEIEWSDVDLEARDEHDRKVGELVLRGGPNKTHVFRRVDLAVSPALRALLAALKLATGGNGSVFGLTKQQVIAAERRLVGKNENRPTTATKRKRRQPPRPLNYGAPDNFNWQACRCTTATVLVNTAIFPGGSAPFRESKQLGHKVATAEKHYLAVHRFNREARTVEAALTIEDEMREVIALVSTPQTAHTRSSAS